MFHGDFSLSSSDKAQHFGLDAKVFFSNLKEALNEIKETAEVENNKHYLKENSVKFFSDLEDGNIHYLSKGQDLDLIPKFEKGYARYNLAKFV